MRREALLSAFVATALAALLAWLGPPGTDFAAHSYLRAVFLRHGFTLWDNLWYAGHYSFVTYSLLYYPLAALVGIKLLAVMSIGAAALAFAIVIGREWGVDARWSSRTFAVVSTGIVLSAAFPFALGIALAFLAFWALQAKARVRFIVLAVFTLAASPLAFLLFVIVLVAVALGRHARLSDLVVPTATVVAAGAIEVALWRVFPADGRYPFTFWSLAGVTTFCVLGAAATWRVEEARMLRWVFVAYLTASLIAYFVPSELGSNIARLRVAAFPIVVLVLTLRRWRPLAACLVLAALAAAWNFTPPVLAYLRSGHTAAEKTFWRPAIRYLHLHLTPSYRVEAVDTADHWAADYLPQARIPIVRGWFRQDDYPENEILYDSMNGRNYRHWLRSVGARYVVLTDEQPDYSASNEAALVRSGRAGLNLVFRSSHISIFELPRATPILTGPGHPHVLDLSREAIEFAITRGGRYRLAVRYSPYWRVRGACVSERRGGMMYVTAPRAGRYRAVFDVTASGVLASLAGAEPRECSR